MNSPEEVNEALAPFKDGQALFCHYIPTHSRLVIGFWMPNSAEKKYLILQGCSHINAQTVWVIKNPCIVKKPNSKALEFMDEKVSIDFMRCWLKDEYKIT